MPGLYKVAVVALLWTAIPGSRAAAQQADPWNFRAPDISRQQLVQVLERYQAAAQSTVYGANLLAQARAAADSIRARLRDGDMHAGDRLRLTVAEQKALSDTFTVTAGPALVLPVVGSVPLAGVLRSELKDRLTRSVDSVYRDAAVQVVILTRIAIMGGVAHPGFYALAPDALIADAVTAAGGLVVDGRLTDIYIERGRGTLWQPDSLQNAMRRGMTLASLGLEPGDRIVVPVPGALSKNPTAFLQVLPYLIGLPLTLITLTQALKL